MSHVQHTTKPIDRAYHALAALRATESLIGQIEQMEDCGSDLSLLLSLLTETLGGALDEMCQQSRVERGAA